MSTKKIAPLYKYLIPTILVVLIAGIILFYHIFQAPYQSTSTNSVITLPNIPPPVGWQIETSTYEYIGFIKKGNTLADNAKINISGEKTGISLNQYLASLYDGGNFPNTTLVASSSAGSPETFPWALVDGHLVLVDMDYETNNVTAINYSLYNNGNVYIFSLDPYTMYEGPNKDFVIQNAQNLETLKQLVQNFADTLPAEQSH